MNGPTAMLTLAWFFQPFASGKGEGVPFAHYIMRDTVDILKSDFGHGMRPEMFENLFYNHAVKLQPFRLGIGELVFPPPHERLVPIFQEVQLTNLVRMYRF